MLGKRLLKCAVAAAAAVTFAGAAQAQDQVTIGVTLSTTGPAASLGIPERNAISMLPDTLGGLPVRYVVLDDATDPSNAGRNARRLVEQNNVDAIIGSTAVPGSVAVSNVAAETQTPQIALAPYQVNEEQKPWAFPQAQTVPVMAEALFNHMGDNGVKTLAYIGFSDGWGQAWIDNMGPFLEKHGIELVATERYARTDRSVAGQALRLISARPDAVLIGASGTPGVLPMSTLRERGYRGTIYQTHGMANADVVRVAGASAEGMILPTGPVLVAELLPEEHPSKAVALEFLERYEGEYGEGSRNNFAAYAYDAYLQLDHAVAQIKGKAKPGTKEFRAALRDAIENTSELAVTHGVLNWGPEQRSPFDQRGAVLITVEDGRWKLVE